MFQNPQFNIFQNFYKYFFTTHEKNCEKMYFFKSHILYFVFFYVKKNCFSFQNTSLKVFVRVYSPKLILIVPIAHRIYSIIFLVYYAKRVENSKIQFWITKRGQNQNQHDF